jgi:AcrR family transcriptional regulator
MLPAMTSAPPNIAEPSDSGAQAGCPQGLTADGGRQRKRGIELEDAIKSACVAELADLGYGSLTIESVASRAQTGKASIYRRWPTKQDLVMDSITCLVTGPLMRLAGVADDTVTTRDALVDVLTRVIEILRGPQGDAMRSLFSESLRDQTFSGTFECDFFEPRKQALISLMERGVERGEVRPDAVDDVVVDMIAGTLIHRVLIRRQEPTKADLEHLVDNFLIPAISPRSPTTQ